jgi:hypothetical protein
VAVIAAITMGVALANLPGLDIPARRPFFETLAQLTIGLSCAVVMVIFGAA